MLGHYPTHASFSVNDLEAAKNFYVNKLGFNLKHEMEGMIVLESAVGTRIGVYYKPDHKPWDSTVMGIEVENVRNVVDELRAKGMMMENVAGTDESGVISDPQMGEAAWFKDPAGNWICINHFA